MPYIYNFRTLGESDNCLSTFQFVTEEGALNKLRQLHADGYDAHIHPIKHNHTNSGRADYEYRFFDVVKLIDQYGMVLCSSPDEEPEFHGFRPTAEECFDYIDEYWHQKGE